MEIEQGFLIPSTLQPVGEGCTGANYAIVLIAGLSQRCVVKVAGEREIAAECLCALLGDILKLPTLTPVIVTDPRNNTFWFGAREIEYPSLSSRLKIKDNANMQQWQALAIILSGWSQVGQAISFDELIVNGDRNPGNILWNGQNFTLIDHERSLGIQPKEINKLALFATNNFQSALISKIQSASTSAAMAQQALLNVDSPTWADLSKKFSSTPESIKSHYSQFEHLVKNNLQGLVNKAADALTPMFLR